MSLKQSTLEYMSCVIYKWLFLHQQELQGSYHENIQRLEDCVNDKLGEDSVAECSQLMQKYKDVIAKVYT